MWNGSKKGFGVDDELIPGVTGVEAMAVALQVVGTANETVFHGPEE